MGIPATNGALCTDLASMKVGDYIPCTYTAPTSGVVGTFSNLGVNSGTEIPVAGSATPNGLFYFTKVDKGLLIADRVVQHSISWDNLNTAGFIEGVTKANIIPSGGYLVKPYDSNQKIESLFDGKSIVVSGNIIGKGLYSANTTATDLQVILDMGEVKTLENIICYLYGDSSSKYNTSVELYYSNDDITYTLYGTISHNKQTQLNITARYIKLMNFYINSSYGRATITEIKLTGVNPYIIRSLSGGCAYADANGNSSTTDKSLGAFPTTNEWDKYIVNSDLGGKITKGDDNVWHYKNVFSWCKETPTVGTNANINRNYRGFVNAQKWQYATSTYISTQVCFRPVLEYLEPNSKATTLFY